MLLTFWKYNTGVTEAYVEVKQAIKSDISLMKRT